MTRFVAAALAATLTACAMRTDSLAKRSVDSLGGMPRIGVVYELEALTSGAPDPIAVSYYRARLEPLLPRVFDTVQLGPADGPLHAKFVFDDGSPRTANQVWLELSLSTAIMLPAYLRDRDSLDVLVEWRGKPLRPYHCETSVSTVVWLPLLPLVVMGPLGRHRDAAVENMIANFLMDLGADLGAQSE